MDFDLSERPISIENDYSASRYGRLITFPVIVEPRPAPSMRPLEREPEHEHQRVQTMIDAALTAASSEPKKETAVSAATPIASPSETRTFWREKRSHSHSRAVKQLRTASEGFAEYWQQVGDSFMRDVRYFFRPLTLSLAQSAPQTVPAMKVESPSPSGRNGNRPKGDRLRQPVTPGHIPKSGEPDRPATSK